MRSGQLFINNGKPSLTHLLVMSVILIHPSCLCVDGLCLKNTHSCHISREELEVVI
jgi:hypothetical protein